MADNTDILHQYFTDFTDVQLEQLEALRPLYEDWNSRINLISRKDTESFYERHVLHSLGIAATGDFTPGTRIMDLGTGGGFPGIPLAILYPESEFVLIDSIRKKITAVDAIIKSLGLSNASAAWARAEEVDGPFDAVVTRAVARCSKLLSWVEGKTHQLLALKGGDLKEEIDEVKFKASCRVYPLKEYFEEEFFETKAVIDLQW